MRLAVTQSLLLLIPMGMHVINVHRDVPGLRVYHDTSSGSVSRTDMTVYVISRLSKVMEKASPIFMDGRSVNILAVERPLCAVNTVCVFNSPVGRSDHSQ